MRLKTLFLILILALLVVALPAQAQEERIITLALDDFMRNVPLDEVLDEFEAANPGVQVQIVYTSPENYFIPPASEDINEHLDAVQTIAQTADVLLVMQNNLTMEGTRAGYFLDLAPLASADSSLNPSDFLSAAWESFRWDNGLWALPAKIESIMLIYDPAAFDAAGLAYPTASWTLTELMNAARELTHYDSNGDVTMPGLSTYNNDDYLLRSLYGQSLSDESGAPNLNTPELQALIDQWVAFRAEDVVAAFPEQISDITESIMPPMSITGSFGLFSMDVVGPNGNGQEDEQETATSLPEAAPLPGGSIGLQVQGVAVSSGTLYPQEAYALAKFVTESPRFLNILQGSRAARNSLADSGNEPIELEGGMRLMTPSLSSEILAVVDDLLQNALPTKEMHYADYLTLIVNALLEENPEVDPTTALEEAELDAANNLQTAADRLGTTVVSVATPVPEVVLAPGEVSLNFSAGFTAQTGDWERLMREFAEADPQVGEVILNNSFGDISTQVEQNDCFYLDYNAVPSADLSLLLPLDPLLSADADFSQDDVAGNALAQLQRDNSTWAFPLTISPTLLNIHADLFAQAGIAEPTDGWTVSEFVEALRALQSVVEEDQAPFTNQGFGDTTLLVLIAAYGGLPFDFRTDPATINFTDSTTVEAVRQVLDLAKEGLIEYRELGGDRGFAIAFSPEDERAIYSDTVGGARFVRVGGLGGDEAESPYRLANFPEGSITATAYEIGSAYISATSQNADACYRLFKFVAQHPELFNTMPALRSQFSNPTLLAAVGESALDFYTQYDALMQNPDIVIIPSAFSGGSNAAGMNIMRRWLDQAFDEYVLRDGDLEAELADAQTKVQTFQTCVAELAPYDPNSPQTYQQGLADCATSIDPNAVMMFPIGAP